MKKGIYLLLFLFTYVGFAQDTSQNVVEIKTDTTVTITYHKDFKISEKRAFDTDLKEKYSGKEFIYIEKEKKKQTPKKTDSTPINEELIKFILFFMKKIFPFLLGGFIIFLILKAFLGFKIDFWKSAKKSQILSKKLVYEDDDIHEINLEDLLKKALENNDYRLAIRYYYLSVLKLLSNKKLIEYHKDKTNTEYLFEIKDNDFKKQFSYLTYVYTYVWYGEFFIDEQHFLVVKKKYQQFIKSIV
ncbi:hypothetical protein [uncultured Polaribacter sp.]|uniref:hypothetical protein n=1 Tax=uncultured Polaribacter sp. TaxID=174711 RepID=UPI00262FA576|nr:hypothetical protein [uncultured Polaribacter sp.]